MKEITLGDIRKQHRVKQEVVAMALSVTASGVSKLESKRIQDVSLQRAAAYLAAVGGNMKIEVTMPDGATLQVGQQGVLICCCINAQQGTTNPSFNTSPYRLLPTQRDLKCS